ELKLNYEWQAKEQVAKVTVQQTQKAGDDVLLFEIPTKLRFIVDDKTIDEPITIAKKEQDFFVRLPGEPQIVRFDPEYCVLAKVDFSLSDAMLKAQLKDKSDAMGRVLACDNLAKRKTKSSVAALKDALQNDAFYGVRNSAATALRRIGTKEAIDALV